MYLPDPGGGGAKGEGDATCAPQGRSMRMRCLAAAKGLLATGEEAASLVRRIAPDGPLAQLGSALLDAATPSGREAAAVAPWHPPHPSWYVRAARKLPPPAARLYLDRLPPEIGRRTLSFLDRTLAAAVGAATPLAASDDVEALIGSVAPGPFPAPPAWATPSGTPQRIAAAAAADTDGPWDAGAVMRAAAAIDGRISDPALRRGLARIAAALVDAPDEAWGLAGSWPEPFGTALLRARDGWKEAPRGCSGAARPHVLGRWAAWAG